MKLVSVYDRPINEDTIKLLYDWLAQRTAVQSISHKTMPSLEEHRKFVLSRPYPDWYVIYAPFHYGIPVGSIYLTDRHEVGIQIALFHRHKGVGSAAIEALQALHPGRLFANINPLNTASIAFFEKHGAKLLQLTYELKG